MSQANFDNFEQCSLEQFAEKAYLDYSMYVILDRALPQLADGLKPVQRRILYAMSELSLSPQAKYKKSARTIGDVLGKFHPHGDSACYEAMVLMAQPFSYRYPLVDGQGNWGSPDDPKSFAAMRYTEAKLTPYSNSLLDELNQGNTQWIANFDGTLQEPALLPARLPNILLNGTTGIAVGMATDIPPHNLTEVANACIYLLSHPKATLDQITDYILGPDFPTAAELITPKEEIRSIYTQGHGSLRLRAVYTQEEGDIVITALPYQVSGAKVIEQIAQQMRDKKLPLIEDIRDESDHENPTRIVIVLRSNRIDVQALMDHLFVTTDLERSYRVNLNMIGLDGRPQVKDLLSLLKEWLSYRKTSVLKRTQFRLNKVNDRLHILDGLLIAYLNLDELIYLLRHEDEPKPLMMQRFKLSEAQAEAILELKLRHLAKLEEQKIRTEQKTLLKERAYLESILNSEKILHNLIKKELEEDIQKYGDERRTPLVERSQAQAFNAQTFMSADPLTIILSQKGWIRAAKGHEIDPSTLSYKTGDAFKQALLARSNTSIILLDSSGRSYTIPAHSLPSARTQGEPLTGRLTPPPGVNFEGMLFGENADLWVLLTDQGYGFTVTLETLYSKNRSGKLIIKVPEHNRLLPPQRLGAIEKDRIALITTAGYLLVFPASEVPILPKGKGSKFMSLAENERVAHFAILKPKNSLALYSSRRSLTLKPADLKPYQAHRAKRGRQLAKEFHKIERIAVIED